MAFEPVPCACGGDGSAGVACTPYEQTGLCLADGTPIAVVTSRDCTTGDVTQIGWLNLTTGAFAAGPPPAGVVACGGGQSIQVSGVFCDVLAGEVVGLVLVEYQYAADGSIASVRLVDAATGATYVLQGELSVCPGGAEGVALDVETKLMCLIETASGTVRGQVLGEFVYNTQTGARVSARFVDPATGFPVTIPGGVVPRECPDVLEQTVLLEQGCLTTTPLASGWFAPFPGVVDVDTNPAWELSRNSGATWTANPHHEWNQINCPAGGCTRLRQRFTIPAGMSGTVAVTISGDIDAGDAGRIYVDGVNQGVVTPIGGPFTVQIPATPGVHVYEFRHGTEVIPGLTIPTVAVDFSGVVPVPSTESIEVVKIVDAAGAIADIRYYDATGNEVTLAAGQVVTVGACVEPETECSEVLAECTYHLPDVNNGWDLEPAAFPGCWNGAAINPSYEWGDRVTSFEFASYQVPGGTFSVVAPTSPDLGGVLPLANLVPPIPIDPLQTAPGYVGTMVVNGVIVTVTAIGGNGLSRWANGIGLLPGDGVRIEFSKPVRFTLATTTFADPPSTNERLCGVQATTVPWNAVKLADCQGVVTTVDADTRIPLSAAAVIDTCTDPSGVADQPCRDSSTLMLCDDTGDVVAPTTSQVPLDTLADGPTGGTLPNGVGFTVNQGMYFPQQQGSVYYFQSDSPQQVWTFDQPVAVTFTVRQTLVFGGQCVTLPAGSVLQTLHANQTYDPVTRSLCSTTGNVNTMSTFTHPGATELAFTPTTDAANQGIGLMEVTPLAAAPADPVQFLRTVSVDCETGAVTITDTDMAGAPYVVQGTVGVCAAGSADQPCRDTSSLLVCDQTPPDPGQLIVNGTFAGSAAGWTLAGNVGQSTLPAYVSPDGTPGVLVFSGGNQTPNGVASQTVAVDPGATYRLQARVGALSTGGNAAVRGLVEVLDGSGVVLASATVTPPYVVGAATVSWLPVGAIDLSGIVATDGTLTVRFTDKSPAPADGVDLTVDDVSLLQTVGVPVQFLRNVTVDCETGAVVTVTDTTMDGQPYVVAGVVGQCSASCGTCEGPPEPCRNTSSLLVCDLPAGGTPDPTVTDTSPTPYATNPGSVPVVGGASALWSGGVLNIAADTAPPPDGSVQFVRTFAATAQAPRPGCDTGTAKITATVTAERTGPDAACIGAGYFQLLVGTTVIATSSVTPSTPVGNVEVLTVTAQVSSADLAAGNVVLLGLWETYQRGASCPGGSNPDGARIGGWIVDDFSAEVVYDQTGCETQFLRNVVTDCETGQVVAVTDTTVDGAPYVVTGNVGQCVPAVEQSEDCSSCETIPLCHIVGTGDPSFYKPGLRYAVQNPVTYPNGLAVTKGVTPGNVVNVPDLFTLVGPLAGSFTGNLPMQVRYQVSVTAGQVVQLPADSSVVDLDPAHSWDPATFRITGGAGSDGSSSTDQWSTFYVPSTEAATFQIVSGSGDSFLRNVEFATAAPVPFLRAVCRDCTGAVVTVTDTTMDGQPYVVTGEVGQCSDLNADCCQPETVCLQQNPVQVVEFISNEPRLDDDSIDTVWTWTPNGDANGPLPAATWYQTYRATYSANPGQWSVVDTDTDRPAGWISPHPNGATSTTGAAGEGPTISAQPWWARASFNLPDSADPASIRVQITVLNADQEASRFRLNNGAWQTMPPPPVGTFNGTPFTFGPGVLAGAQPGLNTLYFQVQETLPDSPGNGAGVMAHFIVTYELGRPGRRQWTRMLCCDGTFYYLDEAGDRQDELPENWSVAACGSGETAPLVLCDDAGPFLRHVTYLPDGDLLVSDTALDGTPYTPVGTVGDCAALASGTSVQLQRMLDCPSAGGPDCVQFLRHYRYDATGVPVGFTDTDLAGAPYTPTGIVG